MWTLTAVLRPAPYKEDVLTNTQMLIIMLTADVTFSWGIKNVLAILKNIGVALDIMSALTFAFHIFVVLAHIAVYTL